MRAVHLVPAGVMLLALGAIGAAASLDRPTVSPNPVAVTRQATVTAAARACPPTLGGGTGTLALIAGPAGSGGSGGSGQAELASLPPAGVQLQPAGAISAKGPGTLSLLTVPAASSAPSKGSKGSKGGKGSKGSKGSKSTKATFEPTGWSVTASGTMAQAMEAEVAQSSGLASLRCGEPGSDIWFVGPGQASGAAQIQLELMNIDSLAATVDVSMITDAGPVQAGNGTGITVPPHETVTESLSSAAGNSSVVAIEVHTSSGRVAADVSEGGSARGRTTNWLPSAAEPSTQLLIPGVPPSSRAAELFLTVPGTADAKVNVLAITPQGHYRPFGSQPIDLPGQSASSMTLTPLGGTAAAVAITANVPVTATVLVPGSGVGAFTTATAPISEQAVVAGNISGSGFAPSVVLSAPAGAARARLTEISASTGSAGSQVISVLAGHTLMVPVSAPSGAKRGAAFAVVITPLAGSGPLYAARVETQDQSTVVSIIPAASALTTIGLPPVSDSYDAINP